MRRVNNLVEFIATKAKLWVSALCQGFLDGFSEVVVFMIGGIRFLVTSVLGLRYGGRGLGYCCRVIDSIICFIFPIVRFDCFYFLFREILWHPEGLPF